MSCGNISCKGIARPRSDFCSDGCCLEAMGRQGFRAHIFAGRPVSEWDTLNIELGPEPGETLSEALERRYKRTLPCGHPQVCLLTPLALDSYLPPYCGWCFDKKTAPPTPWVPAQTSYEESSRQIAQVARVMKTAGEVFLKTLAAQDTDHVRQTAIFAYTAAFELEKVHARSFPDQAPKP